MLVSIQQTKLTHMGFYFTRLIYWKYQMGWEAWGSGKGMNPNQSAMSQVYQTPWARNFTLTD